MREKLKLVNIRVDDETWQNICRHAESLGKSRNQIVRESLQLFIEDKKQKRKSLMKKWQSKRQ